VVIPKTHGSKLHDIPDDELAELLPAAKKLALAAGADNYNILQNNGRIAHQEVDHVHVHFVSILGGRVGGEGRERGVMVADIEDRSRSRIRRRDSWLGGPRRRRIWRS
jgi:diadenosine tetraphosphate (Ap4A) HIT family hydrolase